jgi:hypothetical protein
VAFGRGAGLAVPRFLVAALAESAPCAGSPSPPVPSGWCW